MAEGAGEILGRFPHAQRHPRLPQGQHRSLRLLLIQACLAFQGRRKIVEAGPTNVRGDAPKITVARSGDGSRLEPSFAMSIARLWVVRILGMNALCVTHRTLFSWWPLLGSNSDRRGSAPRTAARHRAQRFQGVALRGD